MALVVTYGDPEFYARVGFEKVSQKQIQAPCALSSPDGWLAQSLISDETPDVPGKTQCVAAYRKQPYGRVRNSPCGHLAGIGMVDRTGAEDPPYLI